MSRSYVNDHPHKTFTPRWFTAHLSKVYERLRFRVSVALGWQDPLIPPNWLDSGGRKERFLITGDEFFQYFIQLCDLKPHEKVFEIGCGTGRMARPLTRFLTTGTYDGIDIVSASVKWCTNAYRHHHSFRFHFADVNNKQYNPVGPHKASEYRFPFPDSSFDFIILTSVFTHMLPNDVGHYLSEITRVLKPDGRCLITYFLINSDSQRHIREGSSRYTFRHKIEGCFVESEVVPEAVVAYEESRVRGLYRLNGLNIVEPIRYGVWCGRENGLSLQDIVIACKPA